MSNICPKYSNFSLRRKQKFLAFLFAGLANNESSCRLETGLVPATNGAASGLLQLEHEKHLRKSSGRDKDLCKTHTVWNTSDLNFQMQCSVSIIRDYHKCSRDKPRVLNYPTGYWENLRSERVVTQKARKFPGC